jgi:hypothetical protein
MDNAPESAQGGCRVAWAASVGNFEGLRAVLLHAFPSERSPSTSLPMAGVAQLDYRWSSFPSLSSCISGDLHERWRRSWVNPFEPGTRIEPSERPLLAFLRADWLIAIGEASRKRLLVRAMPKRPRGAAPPRDE